MRIDTPNVKQICLSCLVFEFNPLAAEKTDAIIEKKVENLNQQPLMGVEREGIPGRLLIIPEVSM
ncbi:MAG: type II toxin-antitoxin system RelE/ParE family toxin, partial [Pseudomonadota bacterium]|nr:type II toxin-antitoxin system RelE/ParE family toxin [Pseudomonadota bacterium]